MPVKELIIPLEPGKYYHIYNRGNNKDKIFYQPNDYSVFLRKYRQYMIPYVKTYAYCLLPNHFHFLIRIEEDKDQNNTSVSNQFRKLFICHARRINTLQGRKGCLMTRNFRRAEILDEKYLLNVVRYIHYNSVKHGCNRSFSNYAHSSFQDFIASKEPLIDRNQVLQWFGGWEAFMEYHWIQEDKQEFTGMLIDD